MVVDLFQRLAFRFLFSVGMLCGVLSLFMVVGAPAETIDAALGREGMEKFPVIPPQHLPDPIPDLVAMIWAERPVQVETGQPDRSLTVNKRMQEELSAISYRARHGDGKEAARLYRIFADEHPETWAGAEALLSIARIHAWPPWGKGATADELDLVGNIALELADKHQANVLTARGLYIFLDNFIAAFGMRRTERRMGNRTKKRPDERHDPSGETWQTAFRIAAILAGRYPDDERGPNQLLEIADILSLCPDAKPRAMEIYQLVCRWPDAWEARFRAFHALHGEAMTRDAPDEARAYAVKAVQECAGRVVRQIDGIHFMDTPFEGRLDTPWDAILYEGLSSDGAILLETPDWQEGNQFAFEFEESRWNRNKQIWESTQRIADKEAEPVLLSVCLVADSGSNSYRPVVPAKGALRYGGISGTDPRIRP